MGDLFLSSRFKSLRGLLPAWVLLALVLPYLHPQPWTFSLCKWTLSESLKECDICFLLESWLVDRKSMTLLLELQWQMASWVTGPSKAQSSCCSAQRLLSFPRPLASGGGHVTECGQRRCSCYQAWATKGSYLILMLSLPLFNNIWTSWAGVPIYFVPAWMPAFLLRTFFFSHKLYTLESF